MRAIVLKITLISPYLHQLHQLIVYLKQNVKMSYLEVLWKRYFLYNNEVCHI